MPASLLAKLKKALKEETFLEVTDALGDDFDYDLVPRTRLNAVIKQRNALRDAATGTNAPETVTKDDDNDDMDGDNRKGQEESRTKGSTSEKSIDDIIKQKEREKEEALKELEKKYAIESALKEYDPQDLSLVSSLLKTQDVKVKDGKLEGLSEQVEAIKKEKPFLFKDEKKPDSGTGKDSNNSDKVKSAALDSSLDLIFGKETE